MILVRLALHAQALKAEAAEILAAFDSAEMDFGSSDGFGYGGGRDLSKLEEQARADVQGHGEPGHASP
jgi:hypothetical protein